MGKFWFRQLSVEEDGDFLPRMFDILYTNMMAISPSDAGYEADRNLWLSYMVPALRDGKTKVVLMLSGEELAGYVQYSFRGETVLVEEMEIRPDYQRGMLFYRCGQYLLAHMPGNIRYMESYVNKQNKNSLAIQKKLGMEIIGENRSGRSWHMQGNVDIIAKRFAR